MLETLIQHVAKTQSWDACLQALPGRTLENIKEQAFRKIDDLRLNNDFFKAERDTFYKETDKKVKEYQLGRSGLLPPKVY